MFTLHWKGRGGNGEPVEEFAHRRHRVTWYATRGTIHASIYLRRDGRWGWCVGDYRIVADSDYYGTSMRTPHPHHGVARSRREAQRRCLRVLRGKRPAEDRS